MGRIHSNFLSTRVAKGWPATLPRDLELRLLDVLSYRSCGPDAIWDELVEWLEEHRIHPPADPAGPV